MENSKKNITVSLTKEELGTILNTFGAAMPIMEKSNQRDSFRAIAIKLMDIDLKTR